METYFFALPGNEELTASLAENCKGKLGEVLIRNFPDGESYVKINTEVKDKNVVLVCTLDHPDNKFLPLFYLAKTAKELGAKQVYLVAPYLSYMRQDKRFHPGEAITSNYFASLISSCVDQLITIDPHLHRRNNLSEIYTIPSRVIHAAQLISEWIKNNIKNPVLIGPDSESEQWVKQVAQDANAPFLILNKTRKGDKEVEISIPKVENYLEHTPVLVDDIISTARTMIETVQHLKNANMKAAVCIGVHPIFAATAYQDLKKSGVQKIISCNSIQHESNGILINNLIAEVLNQVL